MLFGFDRKAEEIIRNWLSDILLVLSFTGVSHLAASSGAVSTLEDAMIKLGRVELSRETPNLSLEYVLDDGDPAALERPAVVFSGLNGAETIGLLEAWQEFTGEYYYFKYYFFQISWFISYVYHGVCRDEKTCYCHSGDEHSEETFEFITS